MTSIKSRTIGSSTPAATKLTKENFRGPWAGLPVAWDAQFRFDEATYRSDVSRACRAGVPGIYSGGTTGEFYAMEFDEFKEVAKATVEVCREHGTPVIVGCSSTYTLGAARRAAYAAELGAQGIQITLPYWMEVPDDQVAPFYRQVSAAAPGLALSIYETKRMKKILTLDQHRRIKDAVPDYLMVKSNSGTLGVTVAGCKELSKFINVFADEGKWAELGKAGVAGCCSAAVYWFPRFTLNLFQKVEAGQWDEVAAGGAKLGQLGDFLRDTFGPRGFTDSGYDRLGSQIIPFLQTSLRCRGPYPHANENDVAVLRAWVRERHPDLLA